MANASATGFETNIFYKILKVLLYALLLTPLWVWSGFLFPFITSKVMYFRPLVELALVFYLPLAFGFPELRPRWNWLTKFVFFYLGIMLATSIIGVNFAKSFWGTVERGEGVITMLHFGAYFLMLSSVLRSAKDWRRYLTAAVIVISFTGILSLGQIACGQGNVEGLCRFVPPAQGVRVSATIGNAAFYAAYMLFGVCFSLLLGAESKRAAVKWLFFVNAAFNAVLLVYTQTRGGAIALYLALFIITLYLAFRAVKRWLRFAAAALGLLMIIVPVTLFAKPEIFPQRVRDIAMVRRLLRISGNDVTTQSRLDTWRASWQGWQDRFFQGYGYENYNIAFNKYFPPRIFKAAGSQIWFDRAHNVVFDVAVTSGIFGLLAYLAIFLAALWFLYRLMRAANFPGLSAVILYALLMGYFIQNLFVFDTHATYLMFFLVLAYLVYLGENFVAPAAPVRGRAVKINFGLTFAIFAVGLGTFCYIANVRPALANHYAIEGIKASRLGKTAEFLPTFQKALSYGTYMDEEIRDHAVDYARQVAVSMPAAERKQIYEFVSGQLEKNLLRSPLDAKNHLYLMNLYNVSVTETQKIERVFTLGHEALRLSPTRMQIYFELGQAAFLVGRQEEGLEYFRKGVDLNPQPKESHVNYLMAGIFAARSDIVDREFAEIASRGYRFSADEEVNLANAFAQICNTTAARTHVEAAVRLEPKFAADAQKFFSALEKKCPK